MYRNFFKRSLDLIFSLICFISLFPVFCIVACVLAVSYKGTPFFYQTRPGKRERLFRIIKFKTMNDKKDKFGQLLPDGERLTSLGAFVRKTSLDELPQLINIIKGEMSFIGPRPLFERYIPFYSQRERLRHSVTPGITGLAQISGRNNLRWDERLELDVQYVEGISFSLDVKIFFGTILNVVKGKDVVVIPGTKFPPLDVERKTKQNEFNRK